MTLILVLNILGMLFIVAGFFLQLPIRKWLEKKYGDNPNKARVYIELFNKYYPVDGKYLRTKIVKHNNGSEIISQNIRLYEYKYQGHIRSVGVPDGYPVRFINGRLSIHVKAGESIACLPGKDAQFNFSNDEYDTLVRSGLAVDLINSVTGKKTPSWLLIVIIAVIAIGAYFLYQNFFAVETPGTPVMPGQPTDNWTPPDKKLVIP